MANNNIIKKLVDKRIIREKKTVEAMLRIYCKHHHGMNGKFCSECQSLSDYVELRLMHCPFEDAEKPTCLNCSIHCYKKDKRAAIKQVMRFAGPRMLTRHPLLTIFHYIDGRKKGKLK
ncbi:MAG TPA: nitrous oxide-stimulated promoter family protein [Candidatus Marinimicrobia bacterium]|jgi:hypothetical protein|nr:nitrous oxide-stimulated promoter family protein [Candidatus Neomarinimicrobiota bacterium]MDP7331169.1 nitrous oxide-stimulated promoter family protein [Candidatus Neomarinimicrobiota bacterium]MDP7565994.1 nitrous oxide-stimulated promoter family protein [Candidatus Neomarinimicrobiota bacterium]HJL74775.1 nitrous oxide-stimulated promoter family protein [Candidatus Neomarinimicrobiota bacterium]HJM70634.1 nitrous oxide-stimulated promoter family protein [Candidatus Neomarinimicrobiota bac|tara:strand:+ start:202 stop:555 length:354 start_codon:yes stop_codon:yes gene_type:complete